MPDAPGAEQLAAIGARHRLSARRDHFAAPRCLECGQRWPCDAARLLAALATETAHWRAAEDDLAAMTARLDAAEVRLPTTRGGTLVVAAAELDAAWRQEREIAARAQFWAAGWRRAAHDRREKERDARADVAELAARHHAALAELDAPRAEHDAWPARAAVAGMFPAETAAVVEAARACGGAVDAVYGEEHLVALARAVAALDAATEDAAMIRSVARGPPAPGAAGRTGL